MEVDVFVERYGEAIEARRATVLVGAGLSMGAGYPSWNHLLEPHRIDLGVPSEMGDLPMMAQFVENQADGRVRLIESICQTIGSVIPSPTESHTLLSQLPLDEVWTTNYDPLIEMAIGGAVVVELEDDFLEVGAATRRVYKMHGSIRHGDDVPVGGVDKLVISNADFDFYETQHPRFWQLLQAQILTKSFLFLGFSFTDPNFEAALRLVRITTHGRLMNHYAIMLREPNDAAIFDLRADELLRSGVHVIEIASYSEVNDVLRKLVARTRPSRLLIAGSQTDPQHSARGTEVADRYPAGKTIEPDLEYVAKELGRRLAGAGISVTTASLLGATAGYALLEELGEDYDPNRMMLVRRHRDEPVDTPNLRSGAITFTGEAPEELRDSVFNQVRSVVILRGGEGTLKEVDRATERRMGVVPLACTGGTALVVWETMNASLEACELGGRPVDPATFAALNSSDFAEAIDAAVNLILQAMYLPKMIQPGQG
jgi:hypothetical protein